MSKIDCTLYIQWEVPNDNGAPITHYLVEVADKVGGGWTHIQNCGIDLIHKTCSVSESQLKSAPFFLASGTHMVSRVRAVNSAGLSDGGLGKETLPLSAK